jgi:hypothetical protein
VSKFALIFKTEPLSPDGSQRVHEVVASVDDCFEVHENFEWIACPDEVDSRDWKRNPDTREWIAPTIPGTEYNVARRVHYGEIGAQLDRLYHAQKSGEQDPLAIWANEQEKIKAIFPKDDPDYVNACNAEIVRRCKLILEEAERQTGVYGSYIDMRQMALDLHADIEAGRWTVPTK